MRQHLSRWFYGALVRLTRLVLHTFTRWEIVHPERLPAEGGVVVVANHLHLLDPPMVAAAARRRLRPMAKRELFEIPLVGWIFPAYGAFPVRRFAADVGVLRTARNALRAGEAVLVFPEGTRGRDARMQPALPGAAMVVLMTGVPVVPVAVTGTEAITLPGSLFAWVRRRRPHVRVEFGEPLTLDEPRTTEGARRAIDRAMREVAALLPPAYRGAYGAETAGRIVFARGDRPADPFGGTGGVTSGDTGSRTDRGTDAGAPQEPRANTADAPPDDEPDPGAGREAGTPLP